VGRDARVMVMPDGEKVLPVAADPDRGPDH
jgi:hypothetical protein